MTMNERLNIDDLKKLLRRWRYYEIGWLRGRGGDFLENCINLSVETSLDSQILLK